jgi:hypothetical protein
MQWKTVTVEMYFSFIITSPVFQEFLPMNTNITWVHTHSGSNNSYSTVRKLNNLPLNEF